MAGSKSFRWESEPEATFMAGLKGYLGELETALHAIALKYAPQIEAWMKQNAPWTDRTGNARQSLFAEVEELVLGARIALDYGVDYGEFLELANQGQYAIVGPALDYWSPIVWNEVKQMMSA